MFYYVNKLKEILEQNLGDKVGYYLVGTIENIPKEVASSNFILLRPVSSIIEVADTQRDSVRGLIEVYVGTDIRKNWDEDDYTTAFLVDCMDIMEGTNDNGVLNTNTVLAQVRQNICSSWINQSSLEVDYTNQRDEEYTYTIKLTVEIYDQRNRNN